MYSSNFHWCEFLKENMAEKYNFISLKLILLEQIEAQTLKQTGESYARWKELALNYLQTTCQNQSQPKPDSTLTALHSSDTLKESSLATQRVSSTSTSSTVPIKAQQGEGMFSWLFSLVKEGAPVLLVVCMILLAIMYIKLERLEAKVSAFESFHSNCN